MDPVALAASIVVVTTVLVLPAAATAGVGGATGTSSLLAIGFIALFNTAIPFVLYQQGLRYLTASSSAVVLTLETIVAVTLSVVYLGETLAAGAWVGAGMILVSIVMVSGLELKATAASEKTLSNSSPS